MCMLDDFLSLIDFKSPVLYASLSLVIMIGGILGAWVTLQRQRKLLLKSAHDEKLKKEKTDETTSKKSTNAHGKIEESDAIINKDELEPLALPEEKGDSLDPSLFTEGKWPTPSIEEVTDKADGEEIESRSRERTERLQRDPVAFCEHIPGEVKRMKSKVTQKKIEEEMTEEQREVERETQSKQLEAIFSLLKEQENKFGISSMDDMSEQAKLYVQ